MVVQQTTEVCLDDGRGSILKEDLDHMYPYNHLINPWI